MGAISLEGIKLSQLRALVTVAALGNFSEAALQLEVSQSAVSHAIAALEEELGVVLLSRGRHGARLTPVGERVTDHAKEILAMLESIGKEAQLSKGLEGGHVRIASFRSIATHVLPELLATFRDRFPAIAVTLLEHRGDEGVESSVRRGEADIGFTCVDVSDEFENWEFMRDEYFALFPPNSRDRHTPLTWDELFSHPLLMPNAADYCNTIIRNHLAKLGISVKPAYEINEDSTMVSMVSRGLGVTIMAQMAAEPLPPNIQVFRLPVPLERVIRVITGRNAMHTPAVYAFLDTLRAHQKVMAQTGVANVAKFDRRSA
jgi:DNA-binding transcriptional LysR family regulator